MNMVKSIFCIVTVAVFLSGAAAGGCGQLVMNELLSISPDNFFTDADEACRGVDFKLNRAGLVFSLCTIFKLNITQMKQLYNEFCDTQSDFRQKFKQTESCLRSKFLEAPRDLCSDVLSPAGYKYLRMTVNEQCRSMSLNASKCIKDLGKPCGDVAIEVTGHIGVALESFYEALCHVGVEMAIRRMLGIDWYSR